MNRIITLAFLSSFVFLLAACGKPAPSSDAGPSSEEAHLGEIDFEVSGSPDARELFREGLLLLHSFEYKDAREAFLKAQEADSTCLMAYWGEAMTHNHPLWRRRGEEEAREALAKLGENTEERLAKAPTEIERDFLQAAEILFEEGEKNERDKAYADYMESLYQKYPGNHEVAAFYALSLLGAVEVGRDEKQYSQSARIAQGILDENPKHPGALHYLIHAYDDPGHAHMARFAADNYADVAPDAAHALHMPSHIYVALGMWHEVVASNIDSWNASVQRMLRLGLDNDARSYHAFHWLSYGLLNQERWNEAAQLLDSMIIYTDSLPSRSARSYLIDMKGGYLVESGQWDHPVAGVSVDLKELNIVSIAGEYFLQGMKAFKQENPIALWNAVDSLSRELNKAQRQATGENAAMCGSSRYVPNRLDVDQATVMQLELKALKELKVGNKAQAEELMKEATELETAASYSYGPPPILYPSFEFYGDWLLKEERYQEALEQYRKALERGPKRTRALKGMLAAAEALQNQDLIAETHTQLEETRELAAKTPGLKPEKTSL
jgi:tetratricopeptide (TPR) repeat protein